jgi:predicted phosphodiesterase
MKKHVIFLFICTLITISVEGQKRSSEKILHGPWIQNLTETSVTIMWITSDPSVPGILFGSDTSKMELVYNSKDGMINGGDTLQKIRITGLEPGKKYMYRIYSRQIDIFEPYKITYSDTIISDPYSFITFSPQTGTTRFIVFNDVHNKSTKMASYLRNIDINNQDLWLFNGDMVDYVQKKDQIFSGFLDTAVFWFAKTKPFIYIRGNHEARGRYARQFKKFFDFKDNSFYSSFDLGPVHFVILDCGEDKPDDNQEYYQLADFDYYRREQLEWLKNEITTNNFRNAAFRIVLCHMPIYKQEKMAYGMKFLSDYYGPILEKAGIDLIISGHTHSNAYLDSKNSGFGYPILVNSSNTFLEVSVKSNGIKALIKGTNGNIMNEINLEKVKK